MFGRNKAAAQQTPTATPLSQAAQASLALIFKHGCALVRPPAGLIAQFHRARMAELTERHAAITQERDAIADQIRALAAALEPVPDTLDYCEAISSATERGQSSQDWN